jgi:hypothetical protein
MRGRQGALRGPTYLALQCADNQLVQGLARLVAVANVLKSLGGILASDVENDLFTATRYCATRVSD